uniref:Putative CRM domain-containing protein At3g25440, chloroplastic n=1 Tax=Anthurium amnicola TaxID=1678845 RepID=A0A1D1ZKE5_9ARAE
MLKAEMWAARSAQRHCRRAASLLQSRNLLQSNFLLPQHASNEAHFWTASRTGSFHSPLGYFSGSRFMSTTRGSSMRSKVEKRMRRETGKTLREIRRAKKLRKKLMTDEERLIYNLRRAKKKVALLLQKLKKYELPELPAPRHDPEILTPEQLQSYKKIGFRNRNYVPVGVRGVFGGVVQNMHLHWKFHETVQVCCDNFPKEKIKEMATMLTRLSGGVVVNIHDVKTIIMFRGRNYRQPKNLIPINTLTKRKALFKARFEQALESQKLNIKKIEQELRRKGVNPEDPVAMASIQRVASTFFRAIDEKQGTPYVFHGERHTLSGTEDTREETPALSSDDSDQEELDRFIAEIEDAADKEWEAEEAAEKEETSQIRYWNREDMITRGSRRTNWSGDDSREEFRERGRDRSNVNINRRSTEIQKSDSDDGISEASGDDWDSGDEVRNAVAGLDSDADTSEVHFEKANARVKRNSGKQRNAFRTRDHSSRTNVGWNTRSDGDSEDALWDTRQNNRGERRDVSRVRAHSSRIVDVRQDTGSDGDMIHDSDDESWDSDHGVEHASRTSRGVVYNYHSGTDEEDIGGLDVKESGVKDRK